MMSSILLNPQLMLYSTALGGTALAVRLISCILCGMAAGIFVRIFFRQKDFFILTDLRREQATIRTRIRCSDF